MLTALALAAFAASVLHSVYALVPRRGLRFAIGAADVLERLPGFSKDELELLRELASWLDEIRAENAVAVARVVRAFVIASLSLAAEILFLGLSVAVG